MAQGNNNNFLTIPSQEGLFRTVKVDRSEDSSHAVWDEDEEDAEEDVRLIPRSSPVPRKRGSSIADETAEYMRIRLALPCRKVSFADSTGAELADVRMFVPFDSDEEDESRWEEEQSRYRKAYREPTYSLWPEFQVLAGTELLLAVHNNKLEVENVTPLADEPLSFEVQIRVLNVSFHKSVFVRSTMDGWISHFDYPAEYVQGSSDGDTDRFSVTLSFASPYLFNGARIDFVVRYETSSGEFWANNSGRNYAVSLLQSYEEETPPAAAAAAAPDTVELRGILKPARYRTSLNHDDCDDKGDEDLSSAACGSDALQSSFMQPVMFQPDIDIEVSKAISYPSRSTRTPSTSDCLCSASNTFSTQPNCDSPNNRPPDKADRVVTFSLPTILVHTCDVTGAVEVPCLPEPNFNSKNDDVSSESSVPFESGLSAPAVLQHIQEECEKNRAEDFHRIMFRDAAMLEEPNQPRTKTQEAMLSLPSNDDGAVSPSKGSPLPEEAQEPTSFSYSQGHPGCPVIVPTMTSDSLTTAQEMKDLDPTEISSDLQKCFTLKSDNLSTSAHQEPEVQQPLPGESAEVTGISKDQEVSVDKCLITSATFFCAVICLTVGIQEPSVFLYLGLFLLSMCF